jgi:glycosyltransferase involved in cell wall biosynthesis
VNILQIAPLWEPVPPPAYGGTEAVVYLLVEELVRQGHNVTLCASGNSQTSARLQSSYPASLRTAKGIDCPTVYAWHHAAQSLKEAEQYDVIHNHAGEDVMALAHFVRGVPMLTTMHCIITPDTKIVWDHYDGYYSTLSWSQRNGMPPIHGGKFAGVAYNGIDVDSFPFQKDKGEHLLFLSRMSEEKGPHLAIEAARRAGRRLVMAGKVDDKDRDFFKTVVEPLIDGEHVLFLGEADGTLKRELYRSAFCVLMPILWDEPFGLVLAEAAACGTPVIAFNRGAAPEIVEHGETGFLVDNVDEMVRAVGCVRAIDPTYCRTHVKRKFDAPVMAGRYLEIYRSILQASAFAAPVAISSNGTGNGTGEAKTVSPSHAA